MRLLPFSNKRDETAGPKTQKGKFHRVGELHGGSGCGQGAPNHKRANSTAGTRTRVAWVKARYPNHLDYDGAGTAAHHN